MSCKITNMRVIISILTVLFPFFVFPKDLDVYIVDRDDYEFKNVEYRLSSTEEFRTDYKTLVLVYDRYRDEILGGRGFYEKRYPSKDEFRKIINDVVVESYLRSDGILIDSPDDSNNRSLKSIFGLYWGMPLLEALNHLKKKSLNNIVKWDDDSYVIVNSVEFFGLRCDFFRLTFDDSPYKGKILSAMDFVQIVDSASLAKKTRENVCNFLRKEYDKNNIIETVNSNGFKEYTFYGFDGESPHVSGFLKIIKYEDKYGVQIILYGKM